MSEIKYPTAWSPSRLQDYEKCALLYAKKYVHKLPEPPRELPRGKTEHANDRGSRIHDSAEKYVRGEADLIKELSSFSHELTVTRDLYKTGVVQLEQDWAFTHGWEPCDPKDYNVIWGRMKLDMCIFQEESAVVVDHKTGRPYPMKHAEQMMLYGIGTMMRHPEISVVHTELWYVDAEDDMAISGLTFRRPDIPRLRAGFEARFEKMLTDRTFKPACHAYACGFCPYKEECEFSVTTKPKTAKPQKTTTDGFFDWG